MGCSWALAAFLGNAWTAPNTLHLQQPDVTEIQYAGVTYDDASLRSPVYYGGRVGTCLPAVPWLSLEGEFIHLKAYADGARLQPPLSAFAMSHGLNMAFVNAAVRVPVRRVIFALRTGIGPTIPHVEATVDGRTTDSYELGSMGWQVGAGLELSMWKGLFGTAEFKWTRTAEALEVAGGLVAGTFTTRHLVVGVGWRGGER